MRAGLARLELHEVEQLALAAGAIIGTWLWDLPSDRFTVDEAFARSFGLDPAVGREGLSLAQVVETVHPDDRAGLAAAIPMAYSCTMGGCGACKVKLTSGRVEMEEPNCLTPAERAAGEVLACVGRPASDDVRIVL